MSVNTTQIQADLVETLRTVACCDQRVGVGELGLVDTVAVDEDGGARVEVLPCCTYGMARLEHEIQREAQQVAGIENVEVEINWDDCWDPDHMMETVEQTMPDIEDLASEYGLEPRWADYESQTD